MWYQFGTKKTSGYATLEVELQNENSRTARPWKGARRVLLPARPAKIPGKGEEVVEIHVTVLIEIPDQPG